jgi:sugar/nucleoside kinase (ribokinase family)
MAYDLTVVGHIVLDYITRKGKTHGPLTGGSCTYAGLAARALGSSVVLVSKVGRDFGSKRLSIFRDNGVSVGRVHVVNSPTTCFRINYRNGERTMKVTAKCEPITRWDISNFPESRTVHIGPLLNEISLSLAGELTKKDSVFGLDPQGYLRRLTPDGTVLVRKWRGLPLLRKINVLKGSENELSTIVGKKPRKSALHKLHSLGPEIILLTRGVKGTIVWSKDEGTFNVPAYATAVRDPTGAGDALIGAFLTTWVRTGDLTWSAAVGSAVSSFVVEEFGAASFGKPKQIEGRAQKIFNRTVRM